MHDHDTSERWLPVPNFPGYEVSDLGRVRSLKSDTPLVLKQLIGTWGYPRVGLYRGTGRQPKNLPVHRLVLQAFVGPCPNEQEAAHLDGVRTNNRLDNLAWVTHTENQRHQIAHGTIAQGERNGNSKLTPEKVREIRRLRQSGVMPTELARRFGFSRSGIYQLLRGETWKE